MTSLRVFVVPTMGNHLTRALACAPEPFIQTTKHQEKKNKTNKGQFCNVRFKKIFFSRRAAFLRTARLIKRDLTRFAASFSFKSSEDGVGKSAPFPCRENGLQDVASSVSLLVSFGRLSWRSCSRQRKRPSDSISLALVLPYYISKIPTHCVVFLTMGNFSRFFFRCCLSISSVALAIYKGTTEILQKGSFCAFLFSADYCFFSRFFLSFLLFHPTMTGCREVCF